MWQRQHNYVGSSDRMSTQLCQYVGYDVDRGARCGVLTTRLMQCYLRRNKYRYVSGSEAAREAIWLKGLLDMICVSPPISLCGDNQGHYENSPRAAKVRNGDPRSPSEVLIPTYHASISETMKGMIEEDWKFGRARVIIASSAWAQMLNEWFSGVKGLDNLDTVVQRFGRAGEIQRNSRSLSPLYGS